MNSSVSNARIEEGEPPWVAHVPDFWFRDLDPAMWFAGGAALDRRIDTEFAGVRARPASGTAGKLHGARSLLAAIVVADQFSRNMFRGKPAAFATDEFARSLSERVIALGFDLEMSPAERYFAYLPFEHSENREHQARAVGLIEALGVKSWTFHARRHAEAIELFGRFPHRNRILGRESTEAELAYLAKHGDP